MALIECYECHSQVSDAAAACPKCGAPVRSRPVGAYVSPGVGELAVERRKVSIWLAIGILLCPYIFSWFLIRKGYSVDARTVGFCWLGFFIILPYIGGSGNNYASSRVNSPEENVAREARDTAAKRAREAELVAKAEQRKNEISSYPLVTASQIAQAYEENTVAADQIFKDKHFRVTGIVTSINTDFLGRPYITLHGGVNQFMEPQFSFAEDAASQIASLRRGAKVTLVCRGRGDVAKTPMSDECQLL